MSSRYMEPLLQALSARFRVYAPDLPGIGRSQAPPHLLGPYQRATVLRAWMATVGLDRAALLAHSAGCEVARQVAEQDPDCISCLILASPAPDPSRRHSFQQVVRLLLDAFRETPSLLLLAARHYLDAGPRRMLHTLRTALRHNRELRRAYRDRRHQPPPHRSADPGDPRPARSGGFGGVGTNDQRARG
jgi:pimeloyl-ACP methyl ester carboxylesterase